MEAVLNVKQVRNTLIDQRSGFTLVELLVVIGLIAMIGIFSAPVYQNFQNRTDVDIAAATLTNSFRLAQAHAMDMVGDQSWGVHLSVGTIVIFRGASYATRDVPFDDVYTISSDVQLTGLSEVVFSKMHGLPSTIGSVTMQETGRSMTVSLNSLGVVSF
ncbi:MAG: prepilin-type N-terminal cleavage/methylation domain-containing protein [Candidatus Kerfeldbacteria bacterium]|nr:prepilin-type N-terminal cleavage/methylation domain-containing protein [Candidatus Kerfeldbacteria bacterium]